MHLTETAMGHKRMGENDDGFKYAMAVIKWVNELCLNHHTKDMIYEFILIVFAIRMCDILHVRHTNMFLRFDALFNLTSAKKHQEKLLGIIHGLTKRVSTRTIPILRLGISYKCTKECVIFKPIIEQHSLLDRQMATYYMFIFDHRNEILKLIWLSFSHSIVQVIKEKKRLFEKNLQEGKVPTPSLSQIIADDYTEQKTNKPAKKVDGLRDDLDDIDENDVGKLSHRIQQKQVDMYL